MIQLSQSFSMGKGNLEHNLRITKSSGIRQNGVQERRFINEYVIVRGDTTQKNYEKNLLKEAIKNKIGENLKKYNEKQIQAKHPERVMTIDDWIQKKSYTRSGKQKKLICEYVINLGNRHTGSPYEQKKDKDGNLLSKSGKIIPLWDTRVSADYVDKNNIKESMISKKYIKPILRDFVKEFEKANPNAEILGYSIHGDEGGAVHAHLSVLWWSTCKNGVGYGIAQSQAIRQQYEANGYQCNNERKDNPLTVWRKDMRALLYDVAYLHGVQRLDMGNKEPHRDTPAFGRYKDRYCEEQEAERNRLEVEKKSLEKDKKLFKKDKKILEKDKKSITDKEKRLSEKASELEEKEKLFNDRLATDVARGEWYYLKTHFPHMYAQIHKKYTEEREKKKKLKNVLDRETNVCYHSI